jgi:RHS repeat-associated protein
MACHVPSRHRRPYFDGSTTYSYDLNGNRTMAGYSTGSDNRLTFDGTYTYTYNAEGDLTQKVSTTATWTYGWDNMNQLVGVKQVTATGTQLSVSYSYDVLSNRVEDDTWKPGTGTVTVRHAYDGNGNIWADVTTTNTLLARYVYGDGVDQVWARAIPAGLPNSGVAWYLSDREGSVRDIMDSSGVVQDHIDYNGYGNATHTTISFADSHGYAGGQTDLSTGLVQEQERWYEPPIGSWMSQDPIGFGGGDANLYRYVGNDATNATDPTGLYTIISKDLRDSGLIADMDAEVVGDQVYTKLAKAAAEDINSKEAPAVGFKLYVPKAAGKYVYKNGKEDWASHHWLMFYEWNITCPPTEETINTREVIFTNLGRLKIEDEPDVTGKGGDGAVAVLKELTPAEKKKTGATHRIILVDAPGTAWRAKAPFNTKSSFTVASFRWLKTGDEEQRMGFVYQQRYDEGVVTDDFEKKEWKK